MPFQSDTYRVLIASPSDLAEERQAATDVINEWNALHAAAEQTVLLPLKWETHALPQTGVRPQGAINEHVVSEADMLIGMFWTKLGTNTGVAPSGTVEEIDQLVGAGKPAMLYFSSRPIDPNKIDLDQHAALRLFKEETYRTAIAGRFSSLEELKSTLMRDLTQQVRRLKTSRRRRGNRIDETERLVEMMVSFRKAKITPADFHQFKDELLTPKKPRTALFNAPLKPGQVGPNGHPVGYTKQGDLVEYIPEEDTPNGLWELMLRRNDNDIHKAIEEYATVIWYDRKLVLLERLEEGKEGIDPGIRTGMLAAMAAAERKYGKRKIRKYYEDDFGWGMLNGKLSALRWVMGDDWDMLDT